MGNINENVTIKILNYNPFTVCVPTNQREIFLTPCYDYSTPTFDTVSFSELSYINSKSPAVRSGLLQFEDNVKKDVYEALRIVNWENILTNQDIEDIILNPSSDKLLKIVNIVDYSMFDRIMPIYIALINSNQYDISNRVTNVIMTRREELRKNKLKSSILVKPVENENTTKNEDVEAIKKQNSDLQEQLKQMQEMVAQLMANNSEKEKKKPGKKPSAK